MNYREAGGKLFHQPLEPRADCLFEVAALIDGKTMENKRQVSSSFISLSLFFNGIYINSGKFVSTLKFARRCWDAIRLSNCGILRGPS